MARGKPSPEQLDLSDPLYDLTREQVGVKAEDGGYPMIVISEGRVLMKNLKSLGRDSSWLRDELKKKGQEDPKNIYLMTVNQCGQSYLAEKEGQT